MDAARDALVETVEGLAQQPDHRRRGDEVKAAVPEVHEELLAASDQLRRGPEQVGRGRRLAAVLPQPRPGREGDGRGRQPGGRSKYLVRNNRTVGVYYPTQRPERAEMPDAPEVAKLLEGYKGRATVAAGEAFEPTPENIEKRVTRGTARRRSRPPSCRRRPAARWSSVQLTPAVRQRGVADRQDDRGRAAARHAHSRDRRRTPGSRSTTSWTSSGHRSSFSGKPGLVIGRVKVKKANLARPLKLVGRDAPRADLPGGRVHHAQERADRSG